MVVYVGAGLSLSPHFLPLLCKFVLNLCISIPALQIRPSVPLFSRLQADSLLPEPPGTSIDMH